MATYVNDLRLKEIATGDEAGTWGTSTNTNLELIAEAFSFGTEAITSNANTHTTTIADGSTDPGRSIFLKYTGALDSDCTITIGPNTVSKLWLIENATTDSGSSGPYNIIIKQGTGATVTIPNSHTKAIYSDGAGSGGAMVEAFTDLNLTDTVTISGSTPTLTIGDAGAEDTKIVFDGNAQDFYIGLDDSADDLVIGKGSAVGTTPAIEIDENLDIKFAESIGVGQAASSTTGDIVAQTMSLLGTTPTLTLGDGGEEDVAIKFNGVKDFYIANDDSADKLVIGEGSTVGTNNILTITDDTVTLGDGAAADTALVFDGNAQDYYVGLDDSADDLLIGLGSTVGTTPAIAVDENLLTTLHGGLTMVGTTPTLTIGDAGAEDTKIVFDGNAQDYYVGLDDSDDELKIGLGSAVGTTPAISINASQNLELGGTMNLLGFKGPTTDFTNSMLISQDAGTGTLSSAVSNTGFGYNVFNVLTSGTNNVGMGQEALKSLTSGTHNIAIGSDAMALNTIGFQNIAMGSFAMDANVAGNRNTAVGYAALSAMTFASDTDTENTAVGAGALQTVVTGKNQTAVGRDCLQLSTGSGNTGMGKHTGNIVSTGSNNTLIGLTAGASIQSGSNNICIGNSADAAHDSAFAITMGVGITGQGGYFKFGRASNIVENNFDSNNSWTRNSDLHKKTNIVNTDIGLSFINELQPVTYNWRPNTEYPKHYEDYSETENKMKTDVNLYGMIAQDVEKALQKVGHENFGGWSKNEDGSQKLSQEMFVYPLINAVKELSEKCDSLQNEINELKGN